MEIVAILDMKKEFVVKSIDSAPDGAPYVVVSLSSIKDLKEGNQNPGWRHGYAIRSNSIKT
jgi:hypothetical protein